jgi:hypothetical protein
MADHSAVCAAPRGSRRCVLYAGHRGSHAYRLPVPADAPYKLCPRCGVAQSLELEYQWRSDGSVFSWCKSCNRAYNKERRAARVIER